jgi:hypothetical protein
MDRLISESSGEDRVRVLRGSMVAVAVGIGVLMFGCAPAFAAPGFAFSASSSTPSAFDPAGGFEGPVGLAVDDSASLSKGSVYVADQGHGVIDKFDEAGVLQPEKAAVSGAGLSQLSVEQYPSLSSEGDVYAAGFASGAVYTFSPALVLKSELTGFSEPTDVTVDEAGRMFVSESGGKVLEFNAAGEPVNAAGHTPAETPDFSNVVVEGPGGLQALAVSADGGVLYLAGGSGVFQYTLSGEKYEQTATIDGNGATGVSLAPSGEVFVDQGAEALEYEPSGTPLARFGGGTLAAGQGVGVSADSQRAFVADQQANGVEAFEAGETPETPVSGPTSAVTGTTATLEGTLVAGGGGTREYHFAYNAGESCEGGSTTTPASGSTGVVSEEVKELQPNTRYTFCLVASNAYGSSTGGAVGFSTGSVPPVIESESFAEVGPHGASLKGQVNMSGADGFYHYEYAASSAFAGARSSTPEVALPAEIGSLAAPASLIELAPGTAYSFRLIVKNDTGEEAQGAVTSFTTLAAVSNELPDDRAYEMVTPPENHNAEVYVPTSENYQSNEVGIHTRQPFDVAANGEAVTYVSEATTDGSGETGIGRGNQQYAVRNTGGGWTQTTLQPNERANSIYQAFSSDLSVGAMTVGNPEEPLEPPLSNEAPGGNLFTAYTRVSDEAEGGAVDPFTPLVTKAMHLNRSHISPFSGERFGSKPAYYNGTTRTFPRIAGGSDGFANVIFEANDALLQGDGALEEELQSDVKSEIAKKEDTNYLYDSMAGKTALIDVSPEGKVVPNATFGGPQPNDSSPPAFSGDISRDGRRVYWSSLEGGYETETPTGIFVRENPGAPQSPLGAHGECADAADACTLQVSAGAARYWASAADGRYAFYTENGALYRFDIEARTPAETRQMLAGPEADVVGVLGTSEDGEQVYFAAGGALATGATASECSGSCNVYSLHVGSAPRFVALLSGSDGSGTNPYYGEGYEPSVGDWAPGLGTHTSEVSSTGGTLVFQSNQSLPVVGYPAGFPSAGAEEVYLYEAASDKLHCVSCSPSGETGGNSFLPISWNDTFQMRDLSDDGGRVFFDSDTPLVAQDTDGAQDVYEWEREGLGSCTSETAIDGGCVYLLSGGTSTTESWLIGASESGDDVFVVTRARLVPEDQSELFNLYDVRVGGVRPVSAPACTGTACQGVPAAPPTFATPASVTFSGVGNFPPPVATKTNAKTQTTAQKLADALRLCRKDKQRKRRVACEGLAHRRYPTKKAKKTAKAKKASLAASKRGAA